MRSHRSIPVAALAVILSTLVPSAPAAAHRVAPTLQESLQYPSLNVRGMRSAWVGDEARTIIPATDILSDVRIFVGESA